MQVIMKPVQMLAWFTQEGVPHPLKYKISFGEEPLIIKVDNILFRSQEKSAADKMIIFRCQSVIEGILKVFELKYELNTCKWFLYRI